MGDLRAAVAVGGRLRVRVDLDGLELLGDSCSWRHGGYRNSSEGGWGGQEARVVLGECVCEGGSRRWRRCW